MVEPTKDKEKGRAVDVGVPLTRKAAKRKAAVDAGAGPSKKCMCSIL